MSEGPLSRKGLIKPPELAIGGVVEGQMLAGVEDRHGGRQLVERAHMRIHLPVEVGAQFLDLADIDGDTGRAAGRGGLG